MKLYTRSASLLTRRATGPARRRACAAGALVAAAVMVAAPPNAAFANTTTVPCGDIAALRAGVISGNQQVGGVATVVLAAGCTYTFTDVAPGETMSALPTFTGANGASLVIEGNGATLQRLQNAPRFRFFTVAIGATASVRDLTFTGGYTPANSSDGGWGYDGGAIHNSGTLQLTRVMVSGNKTGEGGNGANTSGTNGNPGGTGGSGGGIFNGGTLTLDQSTITGNTTGAGATGGNAVVNGGPGGDGGAGGGIAGPGFFSIHGTTISNNTTGGGGGGGGGIFGAPAGGHGRGGGMNITGTGDIDTSLFVGNNVDSWGGAIAAEPPGAGRTLTITNTTFADNIGSRAGAIYSGGTTVTLQFVTFTGNDATDADTDNAVGGDVAALENGGVMRSRSSIIFGNGGPGDDCDAAEYGGTSTYQTLGGTLIDAGNSSCPNDLVGDPQLGPLAANGGPTMSLLPSASGSAHNNADNASCPTTDQRGVARPQAFGCDIGAVERATVPNAGSITGVDKTLAGVARSYSSTASNADATAQTLEYSWSVSGVSSTITGGATANPSITFTSAGNAEVHVRVRPAHASDAESIDLHEPVRVGPANDAGPTLSLTSPGSTVDEGGQLIFTFTTSDPEGDAVAYAAGFPDCGSGASLVTSALDSAGGTFVCTYPNGPTTATARVQLVDDYGVASPLRTNAVAVADVPASIVITGETTPDEGPAPLTYSYTIHDPGTDTFDTPSVSCGARGQMVPGSETFAGTVHDFGGSFQCLPWAGPLTFEPTVTIYPDNDSAHRITATMSVDVQNVAPQGALEAPYAVDENYFFLNTHTFNYVLTDAGGMDDQPTLVTDSVSCGVGGILIRYTVGGLSGRGTIECRFPDGPASPQVSFEVRDIDGAVTEFSQTIDVQNVPPTVTFLGPLPEPVYEGSPVYTLFNAKDQGEDAPTATPPSFCSLFGQDNVGPNSRVGNVACTFPDGPADTTATIVVNDGDATASASFTQHVLNVAPTINASVNRIEIFAPDDILLDLGHVVDPGDDHVQWITVHWGDGTSDLYGPGTQGVTVGHRYLTLALARITIDVTDEDGTFTDVGPELGPILVHNPAPLLTWTQLPTAPKEGQTSTFRFSIADDPTDTHTITFTYCGANNVASAGTVTGTTGEFTCTWSDSSDFNEIIVHVVDSAGSPGEIRVNVPVANAAPVVTPSPSNPTSVDASPSVVHRFTVTAVDAGHDQMVMLRFINGFQSAMTCGQDSIVSGFGSSMTDGVLTAWIDCIFPEGAADRTVVMYVTDFHFDGDVRVELPVHVNPQPLTVTIAAPSSVHEGDTTTFSYSVYDPGNDGYAVVGSPSCGTAGTLTDSGPGFFECFFPDGPATSTVAVSLVDTGTATTSATDARVVSVLDVDPVVFINGGLYYEPGVPYEVTIDLLGDPGIDTITSWTIHWDYLENPSLSTTYTSLTPTPSHVYPTGGRPVLLLVTVTDEDGTHEFLANRVAYDQDTDPPVVTPPVDMTVEATGPNGAVVDFSATAHDVVDGPIPADCPTSGQTFSIGSHTETCTATDSAGNPGQASFTLVVADTTGPAIDVPADVTAEATSAAGALVAYTATASDLVDGTRPVSCSPATASAFAIGTTTVTCTSVDSRGNDSSASFDVEVVDSTDPTVTAPTATTFEATGPQGATATFTATAADLVDAAPTVACTPASGSVFALGVTSVTCTATDDASNKGSVTFDITVVDTTEPTIAEPATTTFEATSAAGAVVDLADVTAEDLVDGTVAVTCTPAAGSLFALGTTPVTCSAVDAHDNPASIEFDIVVEDTTDPTVTIDQAAGQPDPTDVSSIEFTVTFAEDVTGFAADDIELSGTASVATASVVVSGSGSAYTVTVSGLTGGGSVVAAVKADAAIDPSGNGNTASTSADNTVTYSPIVIHVPTDIAVDNDPGQNGAIVSWPSITTSGGIAPVTLVCDHASGSLFAIGTTTVTCTASYDSQSTERRAVGAPSPSVVARFSIQVADAEAPVVSGTPPAIQVTSQSKGPVVVTFALPTAVDNNGTATMVCSPASGSLFPVGVTTVTCTASDGAGNDTVVTFPVTVAAAPSTPGRGIPATGNDPFPLLVWAVGLLGFGVMALRARRLP